MKGYSIARTGMYTTLFGSICLLVHVPPCSSNQTSLSQSDSSAPPGYLWKEERQHIVKPEDPKTLYPRERHCKPPEIQEPQQAFKHDDTTWSPLFSRYTLDAGDELDIWLKNQEEHEDTKDQKRYQDAFDYLMPILFPIAFAIFLCISVVIIPILGAIGFLILETSWDLITHKEIKRTGRRALIMIEKCRRRRNQMLLPEGVKRPPKRPFNLPVFFRLHSGEDVPSELELSEDDDVWLTKGLHSDEDDDTVERKAFKLGASLSGLQINEEGSEDGEGEGRDEIEIT